MRFTRTSRILGPAAAALLAAAGVLFIPAAGAEAVPQRAAAACPGATGITVVVDFNELPAGGGQVQAGCDADGGGRAAANFRDAGFALADHPTQPGYVCQVGGQPADGNCIENDAFWSLWWSDGKSGKWVFSSDGAYALKVPAGGYVAFSWHQGGGRATAPDAVPTPRQPASTPTPPASSTPAETGNGDQGTKGDGKEGKGGKGNQSSPSAQPSDSASASASPSATPSSTASESGASDSASASAAETGTAVPDVADITDGPVTDTARLEGDDEGTFPTWAVGGLAVGVLGAAGAVPLIRRRLG